VDDELDARSGRHADLEQQPALIGTDQHDQVVEVKVRIGLR
jgi:hypothetical protein